MMTVDQALQNVPEVDKEILFRFLSNEGQAIVKPRLTNSALTIEFPTWQITFYCPEDYDEAIRFLSNSCSPAQELIAG